MLVGCPVLPSPGHRLRSEASVQLQDFHFQLQEKLGSMSTQRLDLPCGFSRKEAVPRSQSSRPVGLSVEKPVDAKGSACSIRRNVLIPSPISTQTAFWEGKREPEDGFWEKKKKKKKKSLKRFSEQSSAAEDPYVNRVKRKRSCTSNDDIPTPDNASDGERLSIGQLGGGSFWFPLAVNDPCTMLGITSFPLPVSFPASSSAEEERVCVNTSNNPWVGSFVTEITDKSVKDVDTSEVPEKAKPNSSGASSESHSVVPEKPKPNSSGASSESHSVVLRLNEKSSAQYLGNGSQKPHSAEGVRATGNGNTQERNHGLELVSLLVACVEAIESKNLAAINQFLCRLGELASPEGAPIHRVAAYFTEALAIRTAKLWPSIFHIAPPRDIDLEEDDVNTSFRLLNHLSPIPKFLHFASNEMVLRAFEGKERVHIIDLDIKQGLQWPALFQSLASGPNPPNHVRITGIGESKQELQDTGERLAGFASAFNLPFEFHAVVDRLEDLRLWMLHVKENESVAVNCILRLHKVLYDESGGALRNLLRLIRSTNPTIVIMAEQEAEHNHPRWERRFLNSIKYYSAIFDSIDSSLPLDNPARIKVEELFAAEIRYILACEGSNRIERHESFETWRRFMEESGFRCLGVGKRATLQSRMLLKMFSCENYSVMKQGEDCSGLTLSWLDQPLYTVSSWAPIDLYTGGSSSSLSQPTSKGC